MKRYLLLFSLLLISMHVSAETISVFAQASYQSSDDARPIVEWFHGPEDETFVDELEQLDANGDIHLVHWRTGAEFEGGGWPGDEADIRISSFQNTYGTGMVINGEMMNESDLLGAVSQASRGNEHFPMEVEVKVAAKINHHTSKSEAPSPSDAALNDQCQIHVFVMEKNAEDKHGRQVNNLLRDWSVDASFQLFNDSANNWSVVLEEEHLLGSGIDIQSTNQLHKYEFIAVMMGPSNDGDGYTVFSLVRGELPNSWQSMNAKALLAPSILMMMVLVGLFFVANAERQREHGLPLLKGNWVENGKAVRITFETKTCATKIEQPVLHGSWRLSGRLKLDHLAPGESFTQVLKSRGSGPFHLQLPVEVEGLGEWVLDLKLRDPRPTDSNQEAQSSEHG